MTDFKLLPFAVILFVSTSATAFAQEDTVVNASTTPDLEEIIPAEPEPWYRSDRISGNPLVGDFVVGPGRAELNVKPGETVVTEISVTNRISENRTFQIEIEDVTGSTDGSSALSLVEDAEGPYSLRDYVTFPSNTITLDLGERAWIPVTITLPPNIDPGGLYGTVLISTVQQSAAVTSNAPRNPIIARVGSHIFLNIEGEKRVEGQTLGLSVFPSRWWHESGPFSFGISYQNEGSVHLNPYGELSVRNMFGQEVGYVEMDPWFVLPTSLRTREIDWNRDLLFGRYTVTAQINRGYDDIVDEVQTSFLVLPWRILLAVFAGIFFIIFIFKLFFRTFEFKRK